MKFSCPNCGQHIEAPPQYSRQVIACPSCGQSMQLPEIPNVPAAIPAAAEPASNQSDECESEKTVAVLYMARAFFVYKLTFHILEVLIFGSMIAAAIAGMQKEISPEADTPFVFLPIGVLVVIVADILRYYNTRYTITTERIVIRRGIFTTDEHETEIYRVKDFNIRQTLLAKIFNFGTVAIVSKDKMVPTIFMENIHAPFAVRDELRSLLRKARRAPENRNVHELL